MTVEAELKKDHSDMQAVVDSKQKIIEAQVCFCHSLSHSLSMSTCLSTLSHCISR